MAIRIEHTFAAPAERLWDIVGTPDRTDWVPGVSSCEFDGEVRRMTMQGAGQVAERILSLDHDARCIRYGVIESNPPLEEHEAEIEVQADGNGCRMTWKTRVKPEAVEPFIRQQMDACLIQLEKLLA